MIRFGPAGIPLSCKGRTLRDGISDVHHLGLTALEVQFIKVTALPRSVTPEEVGRKPAELPAQLIVEVGPRPKGTELADPRLLWQPLTKKSTVTSLTWFLAKEANDLVQARTLAQGLDVRLSLHAPYYVDLTSSPAARARTLHQFQWSCALAHHLGAKTVVGHLGFYGPGDRGEAVEKLTQEVREIRKWMELFGRDAPLLGIEPSGHPEVFGTRQEVLELARKVKGVIPVLNLGHLAARENASFDDRAQLQALVDEFREASHGELYLNFSGVETYGGGEFRLTPIKRGRVHFDAVADVLADRDYDATVISSSPLLEHDAMYMKLLYERALAKRYAKKHAPPAPTPAKAATAPAKKPAAKPAPKGSSRPATKPSAKKPSKPVKKAASKPPAKAKPAKKPAKKTAKKPAPKASRSGHAKKR